MAEVTKAVTPSLATIEPNDGQRLPPLLVGEDIAAGDACYVKSDGKIWKTDGTGTGAAGTSAEVDGFACQSAKVAQRQAISLYHDVDITYGNGLTLGTFLFLSTTVKGGLATVVGTLMTKPIGRVIAQDTESNRIRVVRSY